MQLMQGAATQVEVKVVRFLMGNKLPINLQNLKVKPGQVVVDPESVNSGLLCVSLIICCFIIISYNLFTW